MTEHSQNPMPPASAGQPEEHLPLIDLESAPGQPPSRRKRLTQFALLLLAAVVVVLGLVWSANQSGKLAPAGATPAPASAPTLLIYSNVNTGTLTVNGQQQPGQLPLLLTLRPAAPYSSYTFDLILNTPPFLPQSCHVRFFSDGFADSDNTCHASSDAPTFITPQRRLVTPTYEVDFSLGLNNLPPAQQSKVEAALTQGVSDQQTLTVPAGSYFATVVDASGKITSQRASAPLRASGSVVPFAPQPNAFGASCVAFVCATGEPQTQIDSYFTGYQWDILAIIAVRWRFLSAAGALISAVQYQATNSVPVSLGYDGAGNWSVLDLPPARDTIDTADQIAATFSMTGEGLLDELAGGYTAGAEASITNDHVAAGCFLLLTVNNVQKGMYLWRFGVLLAVDPTARAAHPELPVAPAAEVAAVNNG